MYEEKKLAKRHINGEMRTGEKKRRVELIVSSVIAVVQELSATLKQFSFAFQLRIQLRRFMQWLLS